MENLKKQGNLRMPTLWELCPRCATDVILDGKYLVSPMLIHSIVCEGKIKSY
jgi:hypothetical protein